MDEWEEMREKKSERKERNAVIAFVDVDVFFVIVALLYIRKFFARLTLLLQGEKEKREGTKSSGDGRDGAPS
jgi:hypothetical protein